MSEVNLTRIEAKFLDILLDTLAAPDEDDMTERLDGLEALLEEWRGKPFEDDEDQDPTFFALVGVLRSKLADSLLAVFASPEAAGASLADFLYGSPDGG